MGFQYENAGYIANYFEFIKGNYDKKHADAIILESRGENWSPMIRTQLDDDEGHYIKAAQGVYQMLENAKKLLDENSKAVFPK